MDVSLDGRTPGVFSLFYPQALVIPFYLFELQQCSQPMLAM
jgi:hypothetical protein